MSNIVFVVLIVSLFIAAAYVSSVPIPRHKYKQIIYRQLSFADCHNVHHGKCVYEYNREELKGIAEDDETRYCLCKQPYSGTDIISIGIRCTYPPPPLSSHQETVDNEEENLRCPPKMYCLPKYLHCVFGNCRSQGWCVPTTK